MARGEIINLKVYQRVVEDKHVMREYDAVGLSKGILEELKNGGVHLIRILRVRKNENAQVYFTSVNAFLTSPLKHDYIKGDTNFFIPFNQMIKQREEVQSKLHDDS